MAHNHWQIYNWNDEGTDGFSGGFDCIEPEEILPDVTSAAVKASNLFGDGLYGVDLKEKNGKIHVMEVNDNPSIEYGIEDKA